jgi:molybdenum cofactor synthesis domain-containing protein
MTQPATVTAAALVIGDEILSGRTKDKNIGHIADVLTDLGISLREVRIVADIEADIVEAVNALRKRYDYVFTTGGLGPTHDDITADAMAVAFGVGISEHPEAIALLAERLGAENLNEARRRMARIPHGAELVDNELSKAPGFWIGNVIVMAGVPVIMKIMLEAVAPKLARGPRVIAETIVAGNLPEGAYAGDLGAVALANPDLSIGSYPSIRDGTFYNEIVVRGIDAAKVAAAVAEIRAIVARLAADRARAG